MVKKSVLTAAIAALLLVLPVAQGETLWGDWQQLSPGQWYRTGAGDGDPQSFHQEWAECRTMDALRMTRQRAWEVSEQGLMTWSGHKEYRPDGSMSSLSHFNYNQAGILIHGARTDYDPAGTLAFVWACILTQDQGGSFSTQLERYDAAEKLLFRIKAQYDQEGRFVKGERLDPETNQLEQLTQAPEEDPIREEWLENARENLS